MGIFKTDTVSTFDWLAQLRARDAVRQRALDALGCTCNNMAARGARLEDGRWQWVLQCQDCGLVSGDREGGFLRWVKKSHPLVLQAADRIEYDREKRAETKRYMYWLASQLADGSTTPANRYREEWRAYNEFLASPEWASIREKVLRRDGWRCQMQAYGCTRKANTVHHIHYLTWRDGDLDALIAVCPECHATIHPHLRGR